MTRINRLVAALSARPLRRLAALARDVRAVSAVEFALILPILVLMFIAGNEISQALTIYRKVGHTGSTLGDLVAQPATISSAEMTNILAATTAVMTPYSATGLKVVTAAVDRAGGAYKVAWSVAKNDTAWAKNSTPPITIPRGLISDGQEIIVTQVKYTYTSAFSTFMRDIWGGSSITLSDVSYFRPRSSTTIIYPSPN